MAESRSTWILKTVGLAMLVSVVTTLAVIGIQLWLTGKSNGAVAGGVAGGTAAVIFLQRRSAYPKEEPKT